MNRLVTGTLALLICAAAVTTHAQTTFTNLVNFDLTTGARPGSLIQGLNGNLYGTTALDGANAYGTIFEATPAGAVKVLHNFCSSQNCTDGIGPGILLLGGDGNIYGAAYQGGNLELCPYVNTGCGTIFKMTPQGALTTLYSFCSQTNCADGATAAALVQAASGDFYGVTFEGGAHQSGTVFKITKQGNLTTLYSFCPQRPTCTDGNAPTGLVQGANGNFYGTTQNGGTNDQGTVFEITPAGVLTTLYTFCSQSNCSDGAIPEGGLIQAANGNFYGTTWQGGIASTGTLFEITPTGQLTTLYEFCSRIVGGTCIDGEAPYRPIFQGSDANFYGTTLDGGSNGNAYGTAFKSTPSGGVTTLYSFCSQLNCSDGYTPVGLVQSTSGLIYGTTQQGGSGSGTLFSLNVGLGPFVETLPTVGSVGARVIILATNLTGTTAVSFNGTPAAFTVVSKTEITTTVPAGATSGKVRVKTPGGGLSSNVAFRVKK